MKRLFHLLVDIATTLLVISLVVAFYRFGIMGLLEIVFPSNHLLITALRRIGVTVSLFAAYWAVAKYYERRIVTEFAFKPIVITISAVFGVVLIG